jgi:hypothetical protein
MKNMDKNLVFFAENGLTSTSANHIANMAKESIADLERNISSINFVTKSVSLIGTDAEHVVKRGWSKDLLDTLPEKIKQITEMKSLCAWLREAIKARDNMLNDVRRMNIVKYREEIEDSHTKIHVQSMKIQSHAMMLLHRCLSVTVRSITHLKHGVQFLERLFTNQCHFQQQEKIWLIRLKIVRP